MVSYRGGKEIIITAQPIDALITINGDMGATQGADGGVEIAQKGGISQQASHLLAVDPDEKNKNSVWRGIREKKSKKDHKLFHESLTTFFVAIK